jgi:hypothetical protein
MTTSVETTTGTGSRHRTVVQDRAARTTAAVSGIALFLSAWLQTPEGPPLDTATAAQIRDYVTSNDIAIRVGAAGGLSAVLLVIAFTATLAQLIRSRLPGSILAALVAAGGLFVAADFLLTTVSDSMLDLLPGLIGTDLATINDATLHTWYDFGGVTHLLGDLTMAPMMLMVAAFSIAALRTRSRARLIPTWLAWVGVVIAACGAIGTVGVVSAWAALYPFWFAGIFGWVLWILAVALALGIGAYRARRAA